VGQDLLGPSYFFIPLVLGPLNSLVWYVPSLRYTLGLDWCMHCGVEVTELSTHKQHHHHHSTRPALSGLVQVAFPLCQTGTWHVLHHVPSVNCLQAQWSLQGMLWVPGRNQRALNLVLPVTPSSHSSSRVHALAMGPLPTVQQQYCEVRLSVPESGCCGLRLHSDTAHGVTGGPRSSGEAAAGSYSINTVPSPPDQHGAGQRARRSHCVCQ
jgi:hypothetical protein